MKLRFLKRNKLIVSTSALLVVLLIVLAQFKFLSPLKSDLEIKQQSLASEQKLLEIAGQKKVVDTKKTVEDTRELQKEVPVKPLQEQLILDLEKAEILSNSQIKSMGFSKDVEVNTSADQANTQNANGQQTTATNQNTANQTTTNQSTATQNSATQQTAIASTIALKKLTVSLSVESPNYEDLEKFIETLESLKRIVVVESINYSGGQEITTLAQENPPLSFSLTISAFYMPSLADLQAQLPKIDTPAPANKDNPLSTFPDTTKQPN
jgi:type IV pilus assembly protein PilO